MSKTNIFKKLKILVAPIAMTIILLWIRFQYSGLEFHTFAELFSVVVGILMLIIVWNTRMFTKNAFLVYLGIGYFWIAILDVFHTFTFMGMPFFNIKGPEVMIHFWIYARYMESLLLLTAPIFLKKKLNEKLMLYGMGLVVLFLSWAAFNRLAPVMFTPKGVDTI